MRKFTKTACIFLCIAVAAFALFGCSDPGAPSHKKSDPASYEISVDNVTKKLDEFMSGREDRTSYTEQEAKAAEYLRDTLVGYGYADIDEEPTAEGADEEPTEEETEEEPAEDKTSDKVGIIREFTVKDQNDKELISQNVVAVYEPEGLPEDHKNVIIGAYYDNRFSKRDDTTSGTQSSGALANGSGVAALLSIAEYLQVKKPQLGFSVTIAFFGAWSTYGASAIEKTGVYQFYDKQMSPQDRANTVLMIELQRLGVDHVYAYSDTRETKREKFFDGIAKDNGLDIYKVTQKSPSMPVNALDGIPYFQWAMYGNFMVFFNKTIPTLNLVGANWETIDMTDSESADHGDIELTINDTLSNFKKLYPDHGEKIASAATLVVKSLTDSKFLSTMEYDRENFPDTDYLTKNWIWYLIVIGVVLIAGIAMSLVNSRLAKKYPIVMPQPRKMKMAVFGMDYEDKKDDEIYVDIRPPQYDEDIFPGVPNNEVKIEFGAPQQSAPAQESEPPKDENDPFDNGEQENAEHENNDDGNKE